MSGVNKVILIGRLGQDPKISTMPNGNAVANISIATSETWKDKETGEKKEKTEWTNVSFFGRLAEVVGEYLHKGSQVYIEGRLRTRTYEKEGQTHYATSVLADSMQMLGGKSEGAPAQRQEPTKAAAPERAADDFSDDCPF